MNESTCARWQVMEGGQGCTNGVEKPGIAGDGSHGRRVEGNEGGVGAGPGQRETRGERRAEGAEGCVE